jgi:glycerate dehydrogenase
MKIVFPDQMDFSSQTWADIRSRIEVEVYHDRPEPAEFLRRVADAQVCTANWTAFTGKMMAECSRLQYVIAPGVGYDWIDVAAASQRGIRVLNCPSYNVAAVAEHALALMLALAKHVVEGHRYIATHPWKCGVYMNAELAGRKLGVVGFGNIGKRVAALAEAIGMRVQWVDKDHPAEALDDLLATSDVITLHTPLMPATRGLINERRLNLIRKEAFLINTSRGSVVDEPALLRRMRDNPFAGLALDVFGDHPLVSVPADIIDGLGKLPNVILSPYNAYNTTEAYQRLGEELVRNIESCLAGNPVNVVNRVGEGA